MKIILSVHFDLNKPVGFIRLDDKKMYGLIDNFAGIFAAYKASRETGTKLYLTNFEEVNLGGAIKVAKSLKGEKPLVVVVDTCTDVGDKKAYIGNAYNFGTSSLKSEFSKDIFFKDGFFEPTEDETAIYGGDYHLPCFFFGIPIEGKYHDTDNEISLKRIDEASEVLVKVLRHLAKNV